jgi:isoquinoline 1-oxidoreductase subunit beta
VEVAGDGALRIHRCVCAADIGLVINPLGAEAQMMGGTIDGLSWAMHQAITVDGGRVVQGNFNDYPLLRSAEAPDVEVHLVRSDFPPGGAGEMGTPTAAPALANAIFAASGRRLRDTPFSLHLNGVRAV